MRAELIAKRLAVLTLNTQLRPTASRIVAVHELKRGSAPAMSMEDSAIVEAAIQRLSGELDLVHLRDLNKWNLLELALLWLSDENLDTYIARLRSEDRLHLLSMQRYV